MAEYSDKGLPFQARMYRLALKAARKIGLPAPKVFQLEFRAKAFARRIRKLVSSAVPQSQAEQVQGVHAVLDQFFSADEEFGLDDLFRSLQVQDIAIVEKFWLQKEASLRKTAQAFNTETGDPSMIFRINQFLEALTTLEEKIRRAHGENFVQSRGSE